MPVPYAYLRKSSIRDMARETSPEVQERAIREMASRHGDDRRLLVLSDLDVSGAGRYTAKREAYQRLVRDVTEGAVSAVYSYSLSRLGRSVSELSRLFDLCRDRNVPIRLVADAIDTSTASGRLMANFLAAVAQFESEIASERQSARNAFLRARAIERGEDPMEAVRTSPRYGERGEPADVVLATFREIGSYGATARRLNEMGIKARQGGPWWASSVRVVVERLDPTLRTTSPGRSNAPKGRPATFALSRLLRCPVDGYTLSASTGTGVVRYACKHSESRPHPKVSIAEHLILPAVLDEAAQYHNPEEGEAADLTAERATLTDRMAKAKEGWVAGILGKDEALAEVRACEARLAEMDLPKPKGADHVRAILRGEPAATNAALRGIFDRIELDEATFRPTGYVWRDPSWRADV